jgi:uncharacterized membrane protein YGL010W
MDQQGRRLTELIETLAACFYLTLALVLGIALVVALAIIHFIRIRVAHHPGAGSTQ